MTEYLVWINATSYCFCIKLMPQHWFVCPADKETYYGRWSLAVKPMPLLNVPIGITSVTMQTPLATQCSFTLFSFRQIPVIQFSYTFTFTVKKKNTRYFPLHSIEKTVPLQQESIKSCQLTQNFPYNRYNPFPHLLTMNTSVIGLSECYYRAYLFIYTILNTKCYTCIHRGRTFIA